MKYFLVVLFGSLLFTNQTMADPFDDHDRLMKSAIRNGDSAKVKALANNQYILPENGVSYFAFAFTNNKPGISLLVAQEFKLKLEARYSDYPEDLNLYGIKHFAWRALRRSANVALKDKNKEARAWKIVAANSILLGEDTAPLWHAAIRNECFHRSSDESNDASLIASNLAMDACEAKPEKCTFPKLNFKETQCLKEECHLKNMTVVSQSRFDKSDFEMVSLADTISSLETIISNQKVVTHPPKYESHYKSYEKYRKFVDNSCTAFRDRLIMFQNSLK